MSWVNEIQEVSVCKGEAVPIDSSVKMPNSTVETKKQSAAWLYHYFPSLMGDRLLFYSVAAWNFIGGLVKQQRNGWQTVADAGIF